MDGLFTEAQWQIVETLSPLPEPPDDPTNAYDMDPRAAELGQMLFFEVDYSGPLAVGDDGTNGGLGAAGESGRVSCASCHASETSFGDHRSMPSATSLAVDWTGRNTPTVLNAAFYESFFWDGRADTLWAQALGPPESTLEMASDRLRVAHLLFEQYRDLYDEIFDPDLDPALDPASPDASRFPASALPGSAAWDAMTAADHDAVNRIYANFGKAIAAYERLLVTPDAPFDRYVAGDTAAISISAKRGLRLFVGRAACVACHSGALFSDDAFHSVGVPQIGPHVPATDDGRIAAVERLLSSPFNGAGELSDDPSAGAARLEGLAPDESLRGTFRTKGLRNCRETGPYMHTGGFTTLREVVEHYNRGGMHEAFSGRVDPLLRPLNLSDREIDDIVAFLETLSGAPVADALRRDTSR